MLNQLDLRGHAGEPLDLPRPDLGEKGPVEQVRAILAAVKSGGDEAIRRYSQQFDGVAIDDLRVSRQECDAALARISHELRTALTEARDSIRAFHKHRAPAIAPYERNGITVEHLELPVARAGCYVPGGRAKYPSTVLMTAVLAKVAGVESVICCVPPMADGKVADETLAAASLAGVDEVYRVGGVQAIAAMAYGTESIAPVDVICGPGSKWVSIAQREVRGVVGVPSAFAGPSEVVVIADATTPPEWAAIDVIVQAEHGPDGLAWFITWSKEAAKAVSDAVDYLVERSPRRDETARCLSDGGYVVLVDNEEEAFRVSNAIAPEHLEILTKNAHELLPLVKNAGAIFLGPHSPASVGDYLAGPSHVLPTFATARFASVLGVEDFCRRAHAVTISEKGLKRVAPFVAAIADAEGLAAHAESTRLRVDGGTGRVTTEARNEDAPKKKISPRDDLALIAGYHSPQVDVDFRMNTNEAPEPPPAAFLLAVQSAVGDLAFNRYPDLSAFELREAVGRFHGVGADHIYSANGSNEVLQSLMLAFGGPGRVAVTFEPTYALHAHIAQVTGTTVISGERDDAFLIDEGEVDRVFAEAAEWGPGNPYVTFICSPNNPTARLEPKETIESVLGRAPGLVVVDEAYGQFAPWSALSLLDEYPNLVVIRTFSKTWSLAALRLGYAVASPDIVAALQSVSLPYHLDAIKQVAGRLAVHYEKEMQARVARLIEQRGRLLVGLSDLDVTVCPSQANFILFRPNHGDAKKIWKELVEEHSVLVRDVSSWPRLEGYLRVTVGTAQENDAFLAALATTLG